MNSKIYLILLIPLMTIFLSSGGKAAGGELIAKSTGDLASPLSPYFTYQGRLQDSGGDVNDFCDFEFRLFASSGGSDQLGGVELRNNVLVEDGYFAVNDLSFGTGVFQGEARYLEINVRCPAGSGDYETLTPRQELTAAPYAHYAPYAGGAPWSGLTGIPAGFVDAVDDDTTYAAGSGLNLSSGNQFSVDTTFIQARVSGVCGTSYAINQVNADGTVTCEPDDNTTYSAGSGLVLSGTVFSADTNYLQRRVGGACPAGSSIRVINADGTVTCETDTDTTSFWSLNGNSGANPLFHYLGTSDNQGLVLRVNATHALRLEPTSGTPNLIGGYSGNTVTPGVYGAVIAGGGAGGDANTVSDYYGTVSGGLGNQAGDDAGALGYSDYATVGGGYHNSASGSYSTVGGGFYSSASGDNATVGGGYSNASSGDESTTSGGFNNTASGLRSTIGGGTSNYAIGSDSTVCGGYINNAIGSFSTIPGGRYNEASGDYSFAAGYRATISATEDGSFAWSDHNGFDFGPTGPNQFAVRATGGFRFVTAINASGGATAGAWLHSGSSQWSQLSDRQMKTAFKAVDGREVAARVAALPIQSWQYIAQDASIRHMGPMARDFSLAFGLGEDEHYIGTLDADGVALAAIQGLYQMSQEKDARIAELETELAIQGARIEELEERLAALERGGQASAAVQPSVFGYLPLFGLTALGVGAAWFQKRRGGER